MNVLGLDGCRDGWIAVLWSGESATTHFCARIEEVQRFANVAVIAIDIPIGLSYTGERLCDTLARRALPGRASTVFNAPPRACLEVVDDYERANEISFARGGKGLSRQSFGLLKKIEEVDNFLRVSTTPFFEVHPELCFARLNADVVLAPKKSWAGVIARQHLLAREGIHLEEFVGRAARRAAPDDVLDAGTCAWTARRILEGDVKCLPEHPDVDDTGREMCIRV